MQRVLVLSRQLLGLFANYLAVFWAWWLSEIRHLIPKRLANRNELFVEIEDTQLRLRRDGSAADLLDITAAAGKTVDLQLNDDLIVRRTLTLPAAARGQLTRILQNELERQSPLRPSQVLFTYRILSVDRITARLKVSLTIIRRDVVDNAISELNTLGVRVRSICAGAPQSNQVDRISAPKQQILRHLSRSHLVTMALIILSVMLLGMAITIRFSRQRAYISDLIAVASMHQSNAEFARQLQREVMVAQSQDDFLKKQRSLPTMTDIIAEITRLLPDGTWLTGVVFDGQQIEIQGFSSKASALVSIFDSSTLFSAAGFRGPMVQGPEPGVEQFDLSMRVTEK